MTQDTYKDSIRKYRGHLRSMDEELNSIYELGSNELTEWSLGSKIIGVSKIAKIAELDKDIQVKFLIWVQAYKRTKNDIDVKLLEIT